MNPDDRFKLAEWLDQYKGIEILREDVLDQLRAFGLVYDATTTSVVLPGSSLQSIKLPMRRKEEFASLAAANARVGIFDAGNWRGILAATLAADLAYLITGKYSSSLTIGAAIARHAHAIRLIRP